MRTFLSLLSLAAVAGAAAGLAGSASGSAEATQARPTLTVRSSAYGRIIFDGRGRALYAFTRDRGKQSRCYGACAGAWPVYYRQGALRAGPGIRRSLIGTTRRTDGRLQITYAGRPLYYYVGDRRAGEVRCQNVVEFGGTWLVVRPSGRLVR